MSSMRYRFALLLLVFAGTLPAVSVAQAPDQAALREMMEKMKTMEMPDEAQMKLMVDQAAKMQTCMAEIDMGRIEAMSKESEALMDDVKALCRSGKREQAQSQAIAYGRRVAASPELKKLAECSADMRGLLPQMARLSQQAAEVGADAHVCDQQ